MLDVSLYGLYGCIFIRSFYVSSLCCCFNLVMTLVILYIWTVFRPTLELNMGRLCVIN